MSRLGGGGDPGWLLAAARQTRELACDLRAPHLVLDRVVDDGPDARPDLDAAGPEGRSPGERPPVANVDVDPRNSLVGLGWEGEDHG
jgi:hypothetical protein